MTNSERFERLVDGYVHKNQAKYNVPCTLSIHRDGVTRYCCSYTADIQPDTAYWIAPDDDRMACPYKFRSHRHAEWLFWQWQSRTGQDGWRFETEEC